MDGPLSYVIRRRQWLGEEQRIPVRIELDRQTGSPAYGRKPSARALAAIAIVTLLLVAAAGRALQFLSREPIVLAVLQPWVFGAASPSCASPRRRRWD